MKLKASARSDKHSGSDYYFRIANSFRVGKYVCALVFALFMIMMLFVYGDKITYNNFRYMLRDIDAAALLRADVPFTSISYRTADPEFESLNNNLVIADQNSVTLYNPAGISVYSVPFSGQNPQLEADGKYLLVHDLGGKSFLLCNSITKLVSGDAKGAICAADVGKSGAFALAISSTGTRYEVDVYNSSFAHSATYGINDFVMDVSISDGGDRIAILTFSGESDIPDTTLRIGEVGREEYLAVETFSSEFPVAVDFRGDSVLVLTDRTLYFYSCDGVLWTSHSLGNYALNAYALDDEHLAISAVKNGEEFIAVFDRKGTLLYNGSAAITVKDMAFCRDALLILSAGQAASLSLDSYDITVTPLDDALCILGLDSYGLVCGKSRASAVFVEKSEK